jgi:hypothetical protein
MVPRKGSIMKDIVLSITASLLVLGITLTPFAVAQPVQAAPLIEGKDHPILLQRMTVTATALPG